MTRPYTYEPEHIGIRTTTDGVTDVTVHVGIGNSDDKLSQRDYSAYIAAVDTTVRFYCGRFLGWWFSAPDAPWQNATVEFTISVAQVEKLRHELTEVRTRYRQDSLAWTQAPTTEFV